MKKALWIALLLTAGSFLSQQAEAMTLAQYIDRYNHGNGLYISQEIEKAGRHYGIDPLFLASIYYTESRFSNAAISAAGAVGIAQLMPDTAQELGADPYSVEENIEGGAKYFRQMLDLHSDKEDEAIDYALAAYNAGPGNVESGIPSYTYDYIQNVEAEYRQLRQEIQGNPLPKQMLKQHNPTRRERLISLLRNRLQEKKNALNRLENGPEKPPKSVNKSDIFF